MTHISLVNHAVLSLTSTGRTSGLVVECGYGMTHVVPVADSFPLTYASRRVDVGGDDLTMYISKLLQQRGFVFTQMRENVVEIGIKEGHAYVALDFDAEMSTYPSDSVEYELPDGSSLKLGREVVQCAEALFRPSLLGGVETRGLHEAVVQTVASCDAELRDTMWRSIVLAGGSSRLRGLGRRLEKEVGSVAGNGVVAVVDPAAHSFMAWVGGSIVASMSTFRDAGLSKEEYEECGPNTIQYR